MQQTDISNNGIMKGKNSWKRTEQNKKSNLLKMLVGDGLTGREQSKQKDNF